VASKSRVGLVPLSRSRVELTPCDEHEPQVDALSLVRSEVELYHRAILRRGGPKLSAEVAERVVQLAESLSVEPGLIVLATLLGHRAGGPDRPCHATLFTGAFATSCLATYREECGRRFGTFDAAQLGDVAGLPEEHNVARRLDRCEEFAAHYAVNATLNGTRWTTIFAERELALDPWWLATEAAYSGWLRDAEPTPSPELRRHRARRDLALKRPGLRAVVNYRERIAHACAVREATRRHLNADHVLVPPVATPATLWRAVANVVATREAWLILSA
jgi:hypothetical protein